MIKREFFEFVYPDIRMRMYRVYESMHDQSGLRMRPCQGMRSPKEQQKIFEQGRTTPGKVVTQARGLPKPQSFHCFGLAVDSCFVGVDPWLDKNKACSDLWADYGKFVVAYGLFWGGKFKRPDLPHAELTYGLTLAEIQDIYVKKGIPGVWATIDHIRGVEIGGEWSRLKEALTLL